MTKFKTPGELESLSQTYASPICTEIGCTNKGILCDSQTGQLEDYDVLDEFTF